MRRMSFAMTERQLLDGTKDVTRRLGWTALRVGDELLAVRKCMGLRKGERQHVLGRIRVLSVKTEPLSCIDAEDVRREGFPDGSVTGFIDRFCKAHGGPGRCTAGTMVRRIEFAFTREPA